MIRDLGNPGKSWEILGTSEICGDLFDVFFFDLSIKYRRLRWIACDFFMFFDDNGDKSHKMAVKTMEMLKIIWFLLISEGLI